MSSYANGALAFGSGPVVLRTCVSVCDRGWNILRSAYPSRYARIYHTATLFGTRAAFPAPFFPERESRLLRL